MIPKLDVYKKRWSVESDDEIRLGLEQIQKALDIIGHPEKKLKVIHVAGTNGKGSTIAFMESILKEHGYNVGVFSSPAIIDLHDQIQIDGLPVTSEELDKTFSQLKRDGVSGMLTDFELLTVAAFVTFNRTQPDYVLVETGMGGRLDSTNVVHPLVSVITTIALDHTAILGNSLEEIAYEKAGIIKQEVPVVVGKLEHKALTVVQDIAHDNNSPLINYDEEPLYKSDQMNDWKMLLKGQHQIRNAALAIAALRAADIDLEKSRIEKGVYLAKLANRFEEISPNVFVDGAHNPAAATALVSTIEKIFPNEKVDFIIGILKGKDLKGILHELTEVASSFTFITFNHPQAASGEELVQKCDFENKKVANASDIHDLITKKSDHKKIITGSLYLLASLFKDSKKTST